jgi:thioesterase domain-containing protein
MDHPDHRKALASVLGAMATRGNQLDPLVALRRGHGKDIVLCVPGAGDRVTSFAGFVASLPATWSVFGLMPHAAVDSHLRAIAGLARDRALHLIGHSHGGVIAYELARQLRAAGATVRSVTLIDTECPQSPDPVSSFDGRLQLVLVNDAPGLDGQRATRHEQLASDWRRANPHLTVWHGPGHHFSILKPPHVHALSQWWEVAIAGDEAELDGSRRAHKEHQ